MTQQAKVEDGRWKIAGTTRGGLFYHPSAILHPLPLTVRNAPGRFGGYEDTCGTPLPPREATRKAVPGILAGPLNKN